MSRLLSVSLSVTIALGMTLTFAAPVRAAAVCDVSACINAKCKRARGNAIQVCNQGCQIDVAENKKKGICK
jgi:hypothetical protein